MPFALRKTFLLGLSHHPAPKTQPSPHDTWDTLAQKTFLSHICTLSLITRFVLVVPLLHLWEDCHSHFPPDVPSRAGFSALGSSGFCVL